MSLFNVEYERILWKDLRRVFPNIPKTQRQRKIVTPPLNRFRSFRNRIFHHEPICWNLGTVEQIHEEILSLLYWINEDIPSWIASFDRFNTVIKTVENQLNS